METIYLDHAATTPTDPEVLGAMMRYFANHFGIPSSIHSFGQEAQKAMEEARAKVAALIGAGPAEIVFTGGGAEANCMALMGAAFAPTAGKNHIVTCAIEHHAVLNTCKYLESRGFDVTYLPVDEGGFVDTANVRNALTEKTLLVSIMHANNEIGTIEPLAEIAFMAREKGVLVHTDAAQSVGKIPVNVDDLGVDMLSLAAHKFYGPKGVGALYIRRNTPCTPIIFGGHQEGGRSSSTENVPGIVGLGKACEIASRDLSRQMDRMLTLTKRLERQIINNIKDVRINSHAFRCLPNILSVSFSSVKGDALVRELNRQGVAVFASAACDAEMVRLSHVVEALCIPPDYAAGTVRFSPGKGNTETEIDHVAAMLPEIIERLRRRKQP